MNRAGPSTVKLAPIFVLPSTPIPPLVTIRAPVSLLVDCVLLSTTADPVTFKFPPIFVLPSTPIPPLVTIRAPVSLLVDCVFALKVTFPSTSKVESNLTDWVACTFPETSNLYVGIPTPTPTNPPGVTTKSVPAIPT